MSIASSTIDRMLKATKKSYELKGRSTTKPGTLLRREIPIRTFSDWDEKRPGFFETDLEAVMGKAQSRVHPAVDNVRQRLPFPMLGLDPDNGTEFINWLLKRYCDEHEINFTRIRPYRKNDNCYVEQKNYTVVRRFLGYPRYDTDKQLTIIKEILKLVELYVNFFQPVMRLKEKQRVGTYVKKKYDTAKTPYQRLLESGILNEEQKQRLQKLYASLNPLDLKRKIDRLTEKLNKTLR